MIERPNSALMRRASSYPSMRGRPMSSTASCGVQIQHAGGEQSDWNEADELDLKEVPANAAPRIMCIYSAVIVTDLRDSLHCHA